jgi:hypothetical protein
MNKGALAAQTMTSAQLLSGQLDGLMAAWKRTIATEQSDALMATPGLHTKESSAVIAELESELVALEHDVISLRRQAHAEVKLAVGWQDRAMLAVRESRDVLVRNALRHAEEHRSAADALATEAGVLEEVAATYRRAVAAIRTQHTSCSSSGTIEARRRPVSVVDHGLANHRA